MSHSNTLIEYFWLGFNILYYILQITAAFVLFRERSGSTWMILIGSLLSGVFGVCSRLFFHILQVTRLPKWSPETIMLYGNLSAFVIAFGGMLFIAGLILYTLRRRALSARIAELEQIIAAQNSRVQ